MSPVVQVSDRRNGRTKPIGCCSVSGRPTYVSIVSLRVCTQCEGQREESGRGVQLYNLKGTCR